VSVRRFVCLRHLRLVTFLCNSQPRMCKSVQSFTHMHKTPMQQPGTRGICTRGLPTVPAPLLHHWFYLRVCVCVCVVLLQYFVSLIVMLVVLVVTVAVTVWALVQRAAVSTQLRNFSHSRWLGSRVVSVLDSGAEGPGFKSQPRRCRVTALGKLFTPIVPLFTKQQNW